MNDDDYHTTLRWALLTTLRTVEAVEASARQEAFEAVRGAGATRRASSIERAHRRWRARADRLRAAGPITDDGLALLFPGLDPIGEQR